MIANGERDEAQDRVVNKTLDLIDNLDADQARSLLRCFIIDEENFDSRALATVAKTVRATCYSTGGDDDALCHFPNGEAARLNRGHLLAALAASAEAQKVAQEAAENAQRTDHSTQTSQNKTDQSTQTSQNKTDQSTQTSKNKTNQSAQTSEDVSNVENRTTNGKHYQQMDGIAEIVAADIGDLEFEKQETRRMIREGHVTINHYYMSKAPEVKPEQLPKQEPDQEPVQNQEKKPRNSTFAQAQSRIICARCKKWYFERDNVLQEDGRGPCRIHTGQVVYYGETREEAWELYGSPVAGYAWNCCRRRRRTDGCYPTFHASA